MKEVFAALLEQLCAGNDALLATLVVQTGSGPRGLGAQMVLTRAGRVAGTIGGGTAEREMTRIGLALLDSGQSAVHTCGRHGERPGASCFGEITVHFQAVPAGDPSWTALAETLLERIGQRRGGWRCGWTAARPRCWTGRNSASSVRRRRARRRCAGPLPPGMSMCLSCRWRWASAR